MKLSCLRDHWELARPRIVGLVLFTMTVAALVAGPKIPAWTDLVNGLVGAGLVIVGAIALNQQLERRSDALMQRTADRPLPSGRLNARQATVFSAITSVIGLGYLGTLVNGTTAILAAASWVVYVWVYTPLKVFSAWQTPVGAVAGAMPTLLGAAVAGAATSPVAFALFGVLYLWQFPHAMAIAWLYRQQFAAAGCRVASVTDPSGRTAALVSMAGAAALLPVSLIPSVVGRAGWVYGGAAAVLGTLYLFASLAFLRSTNDRTARRLLHVSLVYLPLLLGILLVAALA